MSSSRREFLGAALAAPLFVPSSAFGANDRPAYGVIGTGNRGGGLNKSFQKIGAECVALCDVYKPYLEKAKSESPAGVKTYTAYQELLAQKGLDFVVVATPDHQHAPMLYAALDAGKDVYLEKPLSLSPAQSKEMVAAVRKTKQVVQIGMQRRSMAFVRQAKKLIDEGAIGKVSMVQAKWNWRFDLWYDPSPLAGELDWKRFLGNAPDRPFEVNRFRWWRGYWDYSGGNMTDQGTHLMDVVQWMTNSAPPISAVCQGKIIEGHGVEAPNVFSAVFEFPDFLTTWTLDYRSAWEHDWSILFRGESAAMLMDRKGLKLYKEPEISPAPWQHGAAAEPALEIADKDLAEAHQQNFLDCIKSRQEPNCPIETAAAAVMGPHMANLAFRQERKIRRAPDGTLS